MNDLLKKYMAVVFGQYQQTLIDNDQFSAEERAALKQVRAELLGKNTWEEWRASVLLRGDGWVVSFKEPHQFLEEEGKETPETALIDTVNKKYYVLDGDHRERFDGSALRPFSELKVIYDFLATEFKNYHSS